MEIEEESGVEQTCEDYRGRLFQPVSGESRSNQGVIVRPDRSVVIGHGVVARFAARHRADSPSGERGLVCESCHYTARVFVSRDTSEKTVTCVRRSHPARLLPPVQRNGVGGEVVAPKGFLEPTMERFRLFLQLLRPCSVTADLG